MDLTDQSETEGEVSEPLQPEFDRIDVIDDLADVLRKVGPLFIHLKLKNVF